MAASELPPRYTSEALHKYCSVVNTLWGSDRVLRAIQYSLRGAASSPELSEETRALAKTFSVAFSQARYINRIYGVPDGFDGLLNEMPPVKASQTLDRVLKFLIYSCGGVIFHFLENSALWLYIIRRCDPAKIPKAKSWLVKRGLWDMGDNLDAFAQWFWLVEIACKIILNLRDSGQVQQRILLARERGDKAEEQGLAQELYLRRLDLVKMLCDAPMAIHLGLMFNGRPGALPDRWYSCYYSLPDRCHARVRVGDSIPPPLGSHCSYSFPNPLPNPPFPSPCPSYPSLPPPLLSESPPRRCRAQVQRAGGGGVPRPAAGALSPRRLTLEHQESSTAIAATTTPPPHPCIPWPPPLSRPRRPHHHQGRRLIGPPAAEGIEGFWAPNPPTTTPLLSCRLAHAPTPPRPRRLRGSAQGRRLPEAAASA